MQKRLLAVLVIIGSLSAMAQRYRVDLALEGQTDTVLYLARHYADRLVVEDSARATAAGRYLFSGKRTWERGLYALVGQDGERQLGDLILEGAPRFSLAAGASLAAPVRVKGSAANAQMFGYLAHLQEARADQSALQAEAKAEATRARAEQRLQALNSRMGRYEDSIIAANKGNLFFDLLDRFGGPSVPDSVADKGLYYRRHYWDGIDLADRSLLFTPNLFNRMNYFFFGLLYYADSDTICSEVDRLMQRAAGDTAVMRYVLEFITPRYYRSTRNVGWDAVWCHIAERYYLAGRCPWALEGTLHNMRYNLTRLKKSLIGAQGAELWMMDTTQTDAPEHWHSSHRFPERYVILWFWDPDCHHCQEQTAELQLLYDSLRTAPDRRFEVYAVGYESDVEKWKRYVRDHRLPFVNVGGPNVNIDYQEAYNVHGAPTMIILDEHRRIIMNKVLPVKGLLKFLDDHERRVASRTQQPPAGTQR